MTKYFKVNHIFIFLIVLILSSCATKPADRYSCETFDPWMASIKQLTSIQSFSRYNRSDVAKMLAPAFNDEVFVPSFGKSFRELSKEEGEAIWQSMNKCRPAGWANALAPALIRSDKFVSSDRPMWLRHIDDASKTPFSTTIKQRKNAANKQKQATKQAKIRWRAAINQRNEQRNRQFEEFKRNFVAVYDKAYPDDVRDKKNNFADYGSCAPKLQQRFVRCHVGTGECTETGCDRANTDCGLNFSAASCARRLNASGTVGRTYYCDINNTTNYSEDRSTVIKKICTQ